jgi:putative intracellular protease/amidase
MNVGVVLFENFETLDVFGPVEILGRLRDLFQVRFYSFAGGPVKNEHGVVIQTASFDEVVPAIEILLVPGGHGTRSGVNDGAFLEQLKKLAAQSRFVLSVCTGSALLAKAGLLDGREATSNKRAFEWVVSQGENVKWIRKARWVVDGPYYTSSGVSAGMDMTLGFLKDRYGQEFADGVARQIEYTWQSEKEEDPFSG